MRPDSDFARVLEDRDDALYVLGRVMVERERTERLHAASASEVTALKQEIGRLVALCQEHGIEPSPSMPDYQHPELGATISSDNAAPGGEDA